MFPQPALNIVPRRRKRQGSETHVVLTSPIQGCVMSYKTQRLTIYGKICSTNVDFYKSGSILLSVSLGNTQHDMIFPLFWFFSLWLRRIELKWKISQSIRQDLQPRRRLCDGNGSSLSLSGQLKSADRSRVREDKEKETAKRR